MSDYAFGALGVQRVLSDGWVAVKYGRQGDECSAADIAAVWSDDKGAGMNCSIVRIVRLKDCSELGEV